MADVPVVEFECCRFEANVVLRLPATTRLGLLGCAADHGGSYRALLSSHGLPNLSSLSLTQTQPSSSPAQLHDRHAAVQALAPLLTYFYVDDNASWVNPADPAIWTAFNNVRRLRIVEPAGEDGEETDGPLTAGALKHLPQTLDMLSIRLSTRSLGVTARNVIEAWNRDFVSVRELEQLVLPLPRRLNQSDPLLKFYWECALDRVATRATERGVRVESR